ncbi:MAG TPA: ORF6N domain-containing protein [Candidatus Limnocylindria bacterium]|nr:ORF6N domain-containing protein [Candidatus Limnocylindria bacterium]
MKNNLTILPGYKIENKIYWLRGRRVILDSDLAGLYGVSTKVLNQAVKRNKKRFPEDFMFRLNNKEAELWKSQILMPDTDLRSQFATSSLKNMRSQFVTASAERSRSQFVTLNRGQNIKYLPYAFTEQGVAMLSSVLNSERAIQVNIQIMRTFTKIREMIAGNKELREKIDKLELKYDSKFKIVFKAIAKLLEVEERPKVKIGFRTE